MAATVRPIPDGYHSLTPYLVVNNAGEAIEWYKKALGAVELFRMPGPDGKTIMHAELKIGNSPLMLGDECPNFGNKSPKTLGGTPMGLMIYTENVDALFDRAVKAGATVQQPPTNMFWGDRYGKLLDPYGHQWSIGTHIEDVPPEEMGKRAQEAMANMGG